MSRFEDGPFVRGKNLNIAAQALRAIKREDLPVLIAETLAVQHGKGTARSILDKAIAELEKP